MTSLRFQRPPLYLMHGMWCTGDTMRGLADPLREAGFRVEAPTLPLHRHDLSDADRKQLGRTSLLDYADFHLQQIAALPPGPPPILIGHSMGGLLAQMVGSRIPVSGIVLLAPAAPAGFNLIQPTSTIATSHVFSRYGFWRKPQRPTSWHARYGLYHRGTRAERQARVEALVAESGRAYWEIVFWFLDGRRASAVDPRHIVAPTLVLSAEHDRILPPRVIERVARFFPQARYEELADLGHMMFDEPGGEAVAARVLDWLAELAFCPRADEATTDTRRPASTGSRGVAA